MSNVNCPHCQSPIEDEDALFCHFCGESLGRSSGGLMGLIRSPAMKWAWIILAGMIALVMVGPMFF